MTREAFKRLAAERILFLDGATGTCLSEAGMPAGICPEQWVLAHPRVLVDLQRRYIRAGSDILYAPTFSANRVKLKEYGLYPQMEEMIEGLVSLSRQAAEEELGMSCDGVDSRRVYLAGDLTMTGELLEPLGQMSLEELVDIYKEQIGYLVKAGVDLLVVETMMSLNEARAALLAAKEICDLPVMVTMTFEKGGRTLFGTDAKTAGVVLESLGASAIGANCSCGPRDMEDVIRSMAGVTSIPLIAKPNAGMPMVNEEGMTYYDMSAETFGAEMKDLSEIGASILGGCCGTDPSYIKCMKDVLSSNPRQYLSKEQTERKKVLRRPTGRYYLASERQTLSFGLEEGFFLIGERINPTGKKKLQAQLREGRMELVRQFAKEQEEMGARVLDVNMGMGGVSEQDLMLRAITEIGEVSNLPLSLDSSSPKVIEAALRRYPGRALVNSISLEPEKIEQLLPIVAKYGAMFVLLPLSDKGLPENLKEKKEIIRIITERSFALGMRKEDIIVDGLVTTIGANKQAALETLETIRYCKELGMATVCGLSNISFGMPNRAYINGAFLTLAIGAGLTMAIANPSQNFVKGMSLGTDLLLGKEGADLQYIAEAESFDQEVKKTGITGNSENHGIAAQASVPYDKGEIEEGSKAAGVSSILILNEAVIKGNRNGVIELTKQALNEGITPDTLLQEALLPAIRQVGELFEKGKYFLPQLIASAETMKNAVSVLEPLLLSEMDETSQNKPVVIIATVEGDIHDIGKNLVALLLKNNGFRVIDLGKDVKGTAIIEAAIVHRASVIALSALMTTTMQKMKELITLAKAEGVTAKIIIGGAVVTKEYAKEIGADGYARDAASAVHLVENLC